MTKQPTLTGASPGRLCLAVGMLLSLTTFGATQARTVTIDIDDLVIVSPLLSYSLGSYSVAHDAPQFSSATDNTGLPYIQGGTRLTGSVTAGGGTTQTSVLVAPGYIQLGAGLTGGVQCGLAELPCPAGQSSMGSYGEAFISHQTVIVGPAGVTAPQQRTATISLAFDHGVFNASAGGNASIGANAYVFVDIAGAQRFVDQSSVLYGDPSLGFEVTGTGIPLELEIPFSFQYGQPFTINAAVYTAAAAFANTTNDGSFAQGTAVSAFPMSFRWLGVDLQDGERFLGPVDWAQAAAVVPLPAAAWLFGTALLGLGWTAQRRRRRA